MKIGIVGASGYAGGELLRLLHGHPHFEVSYIAAGSSAGESITAIHPQLTAYSDQQFEETSLSKINECELVFLALPHGESAKLVAGISEDVRIVDLGADFRLSDSASWEKYYGGAHAGTWAYGLPEITDRSLIASATRVANPGCYATAIALAAAPAIAFSAIDSSDIVVVAASGTTGAGRSAKVSLLGSEVMNSMSSYKFGGVHQHTPEIEETLSKLSSQPAKISFTPILAPMPRGILATVTARLTKDISAEKFRSHYAEFYQSHFVHILPEGLLPNTSATLGTNAAHIQVAVDTHTNRLLLSCAIDNLGKGAAAQAIQNANLMTGLAESTGLDLMGVR